MESINRMVPWNPECEMKLRNDDQYACLLRLYKNKYCPIVDSISAFMASSKTRSMMIIFRGRGCVELILREDEIREVYSTFISTIIHACDAAILWLEHSPLEVVTSNLRPFEVVRHGGLWVPKYE